MAILKRIKSLVWKREKKFMSRKNRRELRKLPRQHGKTAMSIEHSEIPEGYSILEPVWINLMVYYNTLIMMLRAQNRYRLPIEEQNREGLSEYVEFLKSDISAGLGIPQEQLFSNEPIETGTTLNERDFLHNFNERVKFYQRSQIQEQPPQPPQICPSCHRLLNLTENLACQNCGTPMVEIDAMNNNPYYTPRQQVRSNIYTDLSVDIIQLNGENRIPTPEEIANTENDFRRLCTELNLSVLQLRSAVRSNQDFKSNVIIALHNQNEENIRNLRQMIIAVNPPVRGWDFHKTEAQLLVDEQIRLDVERMQRQLQHDNDVLDAMGSMNEMMQNPVVRDGPFIYDRSQSYRSFIPKEISKKVKQEFQVSELITLKLEIRKFNTSLSLYGTEELETNIYIKDKLFKQCKYLLLNIDLSTKEGYKQQKHIESIDEAKELLSNELEGGSSKVNIPPETEFWGHCSNLQVWIENDYDWRILHSNLSIPLLRELSKHDTLAKMRFKEQIIERVVKGGFKAFKTFKTDLRLFTKEELFELLKEMDTEVIGEIIFGDVFKKEQSIMEKIVEYNGTNWDGSTHINTVIDPELDLEEELDRLDDDYYNDP